MIPKFWDKIMVHEILPLLRRRRMQIIEAENLAWRYGADAVEVARTRATESGTSHEDRSHYQAVARIAERKARRLQGLAVAQQYEIWDRWRKRRNALS